MSPEVEAAGFLVGLTILAAGVILPALPAASRRMKAIQRTRESRQREAAAILSMPSVSPSRTDRTGADVAPNWHSDERPVVSGAEAQVWAAQEYVVGPINVPADVVDEPEPAEPDWVPAEVVEEEPETDDTAELLANESTPLFDAAGVLPEFERFESFTEGWNRVELLERIRRAELALAQSAPKPELADEELAA